MIASSGTCIGWRANRGVTLLCAANPVERRLGAQPIAAILSFAAGRSGRAPSAGGRAPVSASFRLRRAVR
jgi:hypothetical protein